MKRVELLSPAGGYETMVGAFNAGADAVYLGGSKFGARAYADNFDRDQVLDAISYAHLHDKKIYMTVNTLVKENEYGELYDFMLPYADRGLDGVIVQDLGVMRLIRQEFPGIELHASTQQTVTGVYGAKLLKERGCTRVVPARELSLSEMKAIRDEADIEVEAFIHGAMCYCYSGICLFSSVVGGRSGNRGRCAQPCRLPYRMNGKSGEQYPLSLKDMSTIAIIPELIEAGIDSFKIEGRMKKPEYSAGVTALYRKYIDKYYENSKGDHSVSKEDLKGFTPSYSAPEQTNSKTYNEKVDIYACGITFYELCGCFGTEMERQLALRDLRIKRIILERIVTNYPEESKLIKMMTEKDYNERPSAEQILKSDLFNELGNIVSK